MQTFLIQWLYKMLYVCRIPKGIGVEQALAHLEVKIMIDNFTHHDVDDDTEEDTMMDVMYEVDSDNN